MDTELDSFPVASLGDRYSIARSSVYSRLSHLGIEPEKQGTKAFITADQLKEMDSLDAHLKAGGSMAEFGTVQPSSGQLKLSDKTPDTVTTYPQNDSAIALFALAGALQELGGLVRDSKTTDPLTPQRSLREAAEFGYELSSTQLRAILNRKSLPTKGFTALGFTFTSAGKFGHEKSWRVARVQDH